MKKYYLLWYRLDGRDKYLIWISDRTDAVYTEKKQVPVFETPTALSAYAAGKGIRLVEETPILHHFDSVEKWLENPLQEVNCIDCMNVWNLIKDLSFTLRLKFKGNLDEPINRETYDKICQNNTIPAFVEGAVQGGKTNLREKERKWLTEVMAQALEIARKLL
jgi:hypothetical protein